MSGLIFNFFIFCPLSFSLLAAKSNERPFSLYICYCLLALIAKSIVLVITFQLRTVFGIRERNLCGHERHLCVIDATIHVERFIQQSFSEFAPEYTSIIYFYFYFYAWIVRSSCRSNWHPKPSYPFIFVRWIFSFGIDF